MLESLRVQSLMVVALQNGAQILGALAVARTQADEPYTGAELATLQVIGRRISLAIAVSVAAPIT